MKGMKKIGVWIWGCLLGGMVAACGGRNGAHGEEPDFTGLDSLIQGWVDKGYYPGAAICVKQDTAVLFRKSYGAVSPDTPVYVFASHKHRDHFDMDVLHWAERYSNIHYIFSKDCRMSPHFLEKHGFDLSVRELITYVSPCEKYQVDDLEIETLRSTDAGVAFYVKTNGASFYHAGDLNNWKWDGAGELVNGIMETNYKNQIKKLAKKDINLAFVPFDPKLGMYQSLGMEYFLENTNAEYVFPMHMWQDYSGIQPFIKRLSRRWQTGSCRSSMRIRCLRSRKNKRW